MHALRVTCSFTVTTKTANHPKPSEITHSFLQPTTNYLELAIISLKQPDTPNNQPLSAFGQFYHIKFWNYSQQIIFSKSLKNNEYSYINF